MYSCNYTFVYLSVCWYLHLSTTLFYGSNYSWRDKTHPHICVCVWNKAFSRKSGVVYPQLDNNWATAAVIYFYVCMIEYLNPLINNLIPSDVWTCLWLYCTPFALGDRLYCTRFTMGDRLYCTPFALGIWLYCAPFALPDPAMTLKKEKKENQLESRCLFQGLGEVFKGVLGYNELPWHDRSWTHLRIHKTSTVR